MRRKAPLASALLLLGTAACGESEPVSNADLDQAELQPTEPVVEQENSVEEPEQPREDLSWAIAAAEDATTLQLKNAEGEVRLTLECTAMPAELIAQVPEFETVGSEDRFTLGLGQFPVTLIADVPLQEAIEGTGTTVNAEEDEAGVTARAPVPANLRALFAGATDISILYGVQRIGPVPAPPAAVSREFTASCGSGTVPAMAPVPGE